MSAALSLTSASQSVTETLFSLILRLESVIAPLRLEKAGLSKSLAKAAAVIISF